jgi:histidine triad (HIT) family protein
MNMAHSTDFYCDFVLNGKIDIEKIGETDNVLAFLHTKPSWTFHCVLVPKQHIRRLADIEDMSIVKEIFALARSIILERNLHESNYKIITNGGSFQDSQHLHFHLVSGENITPLPLSAVAARLPPLRRTTGP